MQGHLFAAASESVALTNMGFTNVRSLEPGQMAVIEKGRLRFETFAKPRRAARCFFEGIGAFDEAKVKLAELGADL